MQTIDRKENLIRAFDQSLDALSSGRGMRNCLLLPRAACLAVKLGMSEDAFVEAAGGVAADMGAGAFRRAFRSAGRKVTQGDAGADAWRLSTRARANAARREKTFPFHVRKMIEAGADVKTLADLSSLSPVRVWGLPDADQTRLQLQCLFPGGRDFAFVFREDPPTRGELGKSLMRAEDWLKRSPGDAGELVVPNAFSGEAGETTDGKRSFVAQSCLATFNHVVFEFDELPLAEQCAFWAGFVRAGRLPLVSLTFSGGKSIHGCVFIGAGDVRAWFEKRAKLVALFASDPDLSHRVDVQSMRPRTGTRLAGVRRGSNGNLQRLVWICGAQAAKRLAGIGGEARGEE